MKKQTIAQKAATIRRRLKKQGITHIKIQSGENVPINLISNPKLIEHVFVTAKLQRIQQLQQEMAVLKHELQTEGDQIYTQRLTEEGIQPGEIKNFTLFSLDKNNKIIFRRPPRYTWDETEKEICSGFKKKWMEDIGEQIPDEISYLINLVDDMMETRNGDIDPNAVATLNQWAKKITNKNFRKMVQHLNLSRDAYYAKRYESFYFKNEQGKDTSVVLDYAKVAPQKPQES